ncbi:MAG: hypothetical protein WC602_01530 [archaeon]
MLNQKGLEPLISGMLYTIISVSVVGVVLSTGIPYMKNLEDISTVNKARSTMGALDQEILRIASSGKGSSSTINLSLRGINFSVSSKGSIIKAEKETLASIIKKRYRTDFGNFFLCSNCTTNAYKAVTGNGSVLVLENSHIRLEVARYDLNTANVSMAELVKSVRFIDGNNTFNGTFNFYADSYSSLVNTVSDRIVNEGYSLGEGEIIVYVSSAYYNYNLHFNLQSGSDWFSVYITDMNYSA